MRVYLLSLYGENGAEEVVATLDKSKVETMLVVHNHWSQCTEPYKEACLNRLRELLASDELLPDGCDLGDGWGGFELHIVELE